MRKRIGRMASNTSITRNFFILDDVRDCKNFVPGLPLWFGAFDDPAYPLRMQSIEPLVVNEVDGDRIQVGAYSLVSWVPAIAAGDTVFTFTAEVCKHCGSSGRYMGCR